MLVVLHFSCANILFLSQYVGNHTKPLFFAKILCWICRKCYQNILYISPDMLILLHSCHVLFLFHINSDRLLCLNIHYYVLYFSWSNRLLNLFVLYLHRNFPKHHNLYLSHLAIYYLFIVAFSMLRHIFPFEYRCLPILREYLLPFVCLHCY